MLFTAVGGGTDNTVNGLNQPRYTPYHIRHRTEVAGFMSILHGDDRFYNNIFVQNWPVKETEAKEDMGFKMEDNQEVGTRVFDEYPTYEEWISWFEMDKPANMGKLAQYHFSHLPVWVNGNAYFNGAKPCKNEKSNLVDETNKVTVELVEKEAQEFINDLLSGLRERILELKSGRVIFLGGGANLLRRQIEASGKVGQATFVEDINANAKGYAYLYRLQHGER